MDPVSAWGVITGALQVVQIIGQTIAGLSALRGKYQNADLTIRSMIGELSTIKSAITQLHDWATYNAEVNSSHREYEESLGVAIDGCRAIMEVLAEKVAELINNNNEQRDATLLTFKTRVKMLWTEEVMNDLRQRLHSQVRALNLLLQACQCRSSTEQLELLRKVESRHIIKKVADDTITLRSTIGSAASSQVDARSITSRTLSSVGETEFDFDDALLATSAYRRPHMQPAVEPSMNIGIGREASVGTTLTSSDEGYASHTLTPSHSVSTNSSSLYRGNSLGPNDAVIPDHIRSKSMSFRAEPVQPAPGVRRWVSTGGGNTLPSVGGSKRDRFLSKLKRLNTSSRSTLAPSPSHRLTPSPTIGFTRGRRGLESEFTTSIDLNTQAGRTAPDIVKAAQLGTRYDVERLILSGHEIEECHFHSRRNALMVAAHCGKEDIVDLLIQNNAQLNHTDASGSTALHLAASRGHEGVVSLLIMEAMNLESETRLGRTALWVSANNGHVPTTQLLLQSRAKVNARAGNQMTVLHAASRQGDVEIARLLISYGADVDARDASMATALHYACDGGFLDVIGLLIDNKANIDVAGNERRTPLICAAATGQLSAVQLLVKRKSKFKTMDEGGMTALHWAAFNGHVEIVDYLTNLSRNSFAVTNSQGRTPLHLAAMNSQFAVVEYLVRKGCPLETKCNSGLTALHYACRADNVEIVRLLLTSEANIESQMDTTQQRPIHIAADGRSVALIRLLCEKNASLEARDATGDRALCLASRHGHVAAAQTLLDFGSPLHLRFSARSHEDSPLCLAAKGGHLPVVSLLISRGASVLSKDEMGWPPIRYAAYHGHPEVLEALISVEPSAVNLDRNFSPESFGMSPERFGFAPDTGISENRKKRVLDILSPSRLQSRPLGEPNPARRAGIPASTYTEPISYSGPVSAFQSFTRTPAPTSANPANHDNSLPSELPGTLEQGLPSSRSATPTHMHRGDQDVVEPQHEEPGRAPPAAISTQPLLLVEEFSGAAVHRSSRQQQPQILSPSAILPGERLAQSLTKLSSLQLDETPPQLQTPEPPTTSSSPGLYELDGVDKSLRSSQSQQEQDTSGLSFPLNHSARITHSSSPELVMSPRYIPDGSFSPFSFITPGSANDPSTNDASRKYPTVPDAQKMRDGPSPHR